MQPVPRPGIVGSPRDASPRRILVVARWYPSHDDVGAGSFVGDEVAALLTAGHDVVVASWESVGVRPSSRSQALDVRRANDAWSRAVVDPTALSTPTTWGAGAPVARLPAVRPGGPLPARTEIDAHAALLVPFATALATRWPFDMVHAHVAIPDGAAAAAVATALQVPLVVTEHASAAPARLTEPAARLAYRELLGGGRRVVAVSRALASRLEASLEVEPGTIPVVPNIVPFDRFPLGEAAQRDRDELLWVGARREHKGIDVLLRAVAIARERSPRLHLRLIGRAPNSAVDARWRELAEQVGLAGAIAFEPPTDRDGVAAAMRRAGMFVHPSPYETFGMVAAEALASGLPVAARRSGGVDEVLAGQDIGVEVATGDDAESLAAAILRLRSRLEMIDPAALRDAVSAQYPAADAIAAIIDHARDAADELAPPGRPGAGAARSMSEARQARLDRARPARDGVATGPPPAVLVVSLGRAAASRRAAALPPALAAQLTIVTTVGSPAGDDALAPCGRWIEVDPDRTYLDRLAALGGPPHPRSTRIERLVTAALHPRRTLMRRRLLNARPRLRAAAERAAVLAAWLEVASDGRAERASIVAVGAEDVAAASDALIAGGVLAPGGLRWLADAWDAAGRP